MMTIWKFPLKLTDEQFITPPVGSKILCVQAQGNVPCLWMFCNENEDAKEGRWIVIRGTGHEIDGSAYPRLNYIGTVQIANGMLVWHVFEKL